MMLYQEDRDLLRRYRAGEKLTPWFRRKIKGLLLQERSEIRLATKNAVIDAAMSFLGCDPKLRSYFATGDVTIIEDGDRLRAHLRRGHSPISFVYVMSDWRERVEAIGLHLLPEIRLEFDPVQNCGDQIFEGRHLGIPDSFHRFERRPLFVLDAGQPFFVDDMWIAPATWCPQGRVIRDGHLAWVEVRGKDNVVRLWGEGSTEKRAADRLRERLEKERLHYARARRLADAEAAERDAHLLDDLVL